MFAQIIVALALLSPSAFAVPLVVLDAGHEPSRPGAIGTCGKEEVKYNDELMAEVAGAIQAGGRLATLLTRGAGAEVNVSENGDTFLAPEHRANWKENPRLYERASIANRYQASALISIHHDSAAAEYQETAPRLCGPKEGKRLNRAFWQKGFRTGFSLFVYRGEDKARFAASLKLARAIGAVFRSMGRVPSTHHSDAKDCGSCELLDAENGIYYKNLAILRASDVPGVLIEAGVIVDPADEKAVNSSSFRRTAAKALRGALEQALHP